MAELEPPLRLVTQGASVNSTSKSPQARDKRLLRAELCVQPFLPIFMSQACCNEDVAPVRLGERRVSLERRPAAVSEKDDGGVHAFAALVRVDERKLKLGQTSQDRFD